MWHYLGLEEFLREFPKSILTFIIFQLTGPLTKERGGTLGIGDGLRVKVDYGTTV